MKSPSLLRYGIAAVIGMTAMLVAIWFVVAGETDPTGRYLCLSLALGVALLLAVASGRPALGMLLSGALFGTLKFASTVKLNYLHEPVLAPDLRYFLNANTLDVIGKYPGMLHGLSIVLAVAVVMLGLLLWLESPACGAAVNVGVCRRSFFRCCRSR